MLSFSPDGTLLACGGSATQVQLWDLNKPGKAKGVLGPLGEHFAVVFLADDHLLTAMHHHGRSRGGVRLTKRPFDKTLCEVAPQTHYTDGIATLDRRSVVLLGSACGDVIECRELPDLRLRWTQTRSRKDNTDPSRLCLCPDGRIVAGLKNETQLLDPDTGEIIRRIGTHDDCLPEVAVSPDGKLLAVGGDQLRVLELATGKPIAQKQLPRQRWVYDLAFHPSGRALMMAMKDVKVTLLDPTTLTELAAFDWAVGKVFKIAFSTDGMRAAGAGEKGKVAVWDVDV
jgi:WD40 repeat protein